MKDNLRRNLIKQEFGEIFAATWSKLATVCIGRHKWL